MQLINHNNTETFMVVMTLFLKYNPSFFLFYNLTSKSILLISVQQKPIITAYWNHICHFPLFLNKQDKR